LRRNPRSPLCSLSNRWVRAAKPGELEGQAHSFDIMTKKIYNQSGKGLLSMAMSSHVQQLLERVTAVLPVSEEDLVYRGIAAGVTERIITLKKAVARLQERYKSLEDLERKIQAEGVPPGDHTLYTDLLEWRAIHHELSKLWRILEAFGASQYGQ
jgi:hypothetical protein